MGSLLVVLSFSPELVPLFDNAEKDILRLVYDNVFIPFRTKFNIRDVLSNEARLDVLHSGNMLPFDRNSDDADQVRSSYLAASVVLPRGAGGVTTGIKRSYEGGEESSLVKSTESSIFKPTESLIKSSSEILHMGIDEGASLKLIFREDRLASPSTSPSPTLTSFATDSPSVTLDPRALTPIDEQDDFIAMDVR